MTPTEQHAAVLAALAELEAAESAALPAPWSWGPETSDGDGDSGPDLMAGEQVVIGAWGHDWWGLTVEHVDRALIVALRNSAAESLAGRRRILERHAPDTGAMDDGVPGAGPACSQCEYSGGASAGFQKPWPCADYRDAAAGLGVERDA